MRIKCQYKGKASIIKNDEIIMEEELVFNNDYEPVDYITQYIKNHNIDNLENFKIEFEFQPLINNEWTFADIKEGDYYVMPSLNKKNTYNGNIEMYKDLYIVENINGKIYINPYRASYIYNKQKNIAFLVFYNYNYSIEEYEEILVLTMPTIHEFWEAKLDTKIDQFCNLLSANIANG